MAKERDKTPKIVNYTMGTFDCKEDEFRAFAVHLRCNKIVECEEFEDESGCVYNTRSTGCPSGFFWSEGR